MSDPVKRLEEFANGMAEYWDEAPPSLAKDNNGKVARLLHAAARVFIYANIQDVDHLNCCKLDKCVACDFLTLIETELGDVDEA